MIPKEITIGYRKRVTTYNNIIGFVTYRKGKKKEVHHKGFYDYVDKSIPITEAENTPLSGFYFNGTSGGVNCISGRKEKIRVMDPRGFEFELGINGIEHVLTHASVSPGKGIEGEFVYGWFGLEGLMLISTKSEIYRNHNSKKTEIHASELVIGDLYGTLTNKTIMYCGETLHSYSLSHLKKVKDKWVLGIGYCNDVTVKKDFVEVTTKESKLGLIHLFKNVVNRKTFTKKGYDSVVASDYIKSYDASDIFVKTPKTPLVGGFIALNNEPLVINFQETNIEELLREHPLNTSTISFDTFKYGSKDSKLQLTNNEKQEYVDRLLKNLKRDLGSDSFITTNINPQNIHSNDFAMYTKHDNCFYKFVFKTISTKFIDFLFSPYFKLGSYKRIEIYKVNVKEESIGHDLVKEGSKLFNELTTSSREFYNAFDVVLNIEKTKLSKIFKR